MARPNADLVGNFVPTPETEQLIERIAALFDVSPARIPQTTGSRYGQFALLDPCSGKGSPLFHLARALFGSCLPQAAPRLVFYTCELEAGRAAETLAQYQANLGSDFYQQRGQCLTGDGFRVSYSLNDEPTSYAAGANLVFLNPPYRYHKKHKRLEHAFLVQYTPTLAPGGGLVFLVPHYVLAVSSTLLAREYEDVHCYRLPEALWPLYKQVVLVARRRALPLGERDPDYANTVAAVTRWSDDAGSIPEIPALAGEGKRLVLPREPRGGFASWQMTEIDACSFSQNVQLFKERESRSQLGLDAGVADHLDRRVPSATNPRLAMTALALTAGAFDGQVITPNPGQEGLPPILPKGSFEKEAVKTGESTNQDGDVVAVQMVQRPRLHLNVLDMGKGSFHEIKPGSTPSAATSLDQMNIYDVITRYGVGLKAALDSRTEVLHDQYNPAHRLLLHPMKRRLRRTQVHPVIATLKTLATGQPVICLGQVGSGKTTYAAQLAWELSIDNFAATSQQLGAQLTNAGRKLERGYLHPVENVLVMSPSHLLDGWATEIAASLPGAEVIFLESLHQLKKADRDRGRRTTKLRGAGLRFYILSKEDAKLGALVEPGYQNNAGSPRCAGCGGEVEDVEAVLRKRSRCPHVIYRPQNALARATKRLAELLLPIYPFAFPGTQYLGRHVFTQRFIRPSATTTGVDAADETATSEVTAEASGQPDDVAINDEPVAAQLDVDETAVEGVKAASWKIGLGGSDYPSLRGIIYRLTAAVVHAGEAQAKKLGQALLCLAFSYPSPDRDRLLAVTARNLYRRSRRSTSGHYLRTLALSLVLMTHPRGHADQLAALRQIVVQKKPSPQLNELWQQVEASSIRLMYEMKGGDQPSSGSELWAWQQLSWHDKVGSLQWLVNGEAHQAGTVSLALKALRLAADEANFVERTCNEPLWQYGSRPRRYPIATYISRKHRNTFDLVLVDEVHEMSGDGSAQGQAFTRLARLGLPIVGLTGSLSNGKARSLYTILYEFDREFRREYKYADRDRFVENEGYLKLSAREDDEDDERKPDTEYGASSDRIMTSFGLAKKVGEAPGTKPSRIFKMLKFTVPMEIDPKETGMPGLDIEAVAVRVKPDDAAGREMMREANLAVVKLLNQIKEDRWNSSCAGRLMGEQNEAATIYDRLSEGCGRSHDGQFPQDEGKAAFAFRYPKKRLLGELVAHAPLYPQGLVMPKERQALTDMKAALDRGYNLILVLDSTGAGTGLVERWVQLCQRELGEWAVPLDEPEAKKRIAWINRKVVATGARVFIANPEAIKTGLNNLTGFCEMFGLQDFNLSATTFRQVIGRLHRPGQKLRVRVRIYYYAGTQQELNVRTLMEKVAASKMVEGEDWTKALDSFGAGDSPQAEAMDVTELLLSMLKEGGGGGQIESIRVAEVEAEAGSDVWWEWPEAITPANAVVTISEQAEELLNAPKAAVVQLSLFG